MCTYIIGCVVENNINYRGNTLSTMTQPDVDSCRSLCSCMGAPYFSYTDEMKCRCKNSDAGRRAKDGFVSGETSCDNTSDQPTTTPPGYILSNLVCYLLIEILPLGVTPFVRA